VYSIIFSFLPCMRVMQKHASSIFVQASRDVFFVIGKSDMKVFDATRLGYAWNDIWRISLGHSLTAMFIAENMSIGEVLFSMSTLESDGHLSGQSGLARTSLAAKRPQSSDKSAATFLSSSTTTATEPPKEPISSGRHISQHVENLCRRRSYERSTAP